MKTTRSILCALLLIPILTGAQDRYFDSASSGSVWDQSTTSNWGTGTGGPYTSLWASYANAWFEGTGGTVNVSASNQPYANRLNFTAGGYVLTGGTINMGNPGGINNFNVTGSNTATINSNISQPHGTAIQKIGTGTLVLGGTVTSTAGNNRIEGGILRIAGGSFSGNIYAADSASTSGTVELTGGTLTSSGLSVIGTRGNATLLVNGGTANFNGGLYMGYQGQAGAGNSTIHLSSGTLNVASSFILGQENDAGISSIFNQTGGTFNSTGSTTIGNFGSSTSTQTLNVSAGVFNASNTVILAIRGNASINLSGTGTMTLPGLQFNHTDATASSGTFNLNGGTLNIGGSGIFRVADTAVFNFNGGTLRATAGSTGFMTSTLSRANVRNGGAVINDQGYQITIAQALLHSNIGGDSATDGGLSKLGTGDLTLSNASNAYNGGTSVAAGRLVASASGALGSGAVTISSGAEIFAHSSATLANNFSIAGDGGTGSTLDTALRGAIRLDGATVSGTVTLTANASLGSTSGTGTFSGQITESGGARVLSINKAGTGTVVLSNNSNNYSGGTVVHNGTLRVSAPTAAGTYGMLGTGPVTVNSGANLTFFTGSTFNNHTYNHNVTLNSATLQFEDGTTILPGSIALTGNNTFHGVWDGKNLQANGVISGTGGIVKTGDASLLMNNANLYSGDTTITGGEVLIGVDPVGTVGSITSSATGRGTVRLNGGALYSNGATARDVLNPVEVQQNSTLGDGTNNGALTLKGTVNLGGAINSQRQLTINSPVEIQNSMTGGTQVGLAKAGTSTLTLTAAGNWTGNLSVTGGTFQLTGGGTLPNIGTTNVSGAGTTLRINNAAGQLRTSSITLGAGTNLNLEAGKLQTNGITMAGGSSFSWGAATLTAQTAGSGNSGSTDRTGDNGVGGDISGPVIYEGTILTIDNGIGNTVATSNGSVLDLGGLYSSGGLRYDQLRVTGTLNLSAADDTLRVAINPYLLRPSSPNSVSTGDWGTLILVHADTITQKFGAITGIASDAIGWTQLATETDSGRLPSTLGLNEWVLEYRTNFGPMAGGDALLLHYKVSGSVPEPASAGLLVAGALLLRALRKRT